MPDLALARLHPSGEEGVEFAFRCVLPREVVSGSRARVELMAPSGARSGKIVIAQLVKPIDIPAGCAGIHAADDLSSEVAVLQSSLADGSYELLGARGVRTSVDPERFLPAAVPTSLPYSMGPARLAAAWGLAEWPHAPRFALRWALEGYRGRAESDGLGGATWLDVALIPHQLAVVRQVLASPSVRHVLADEVGLGKTIEALMIWAALSTYEPDLKTLVVAPRSLIPQWCIELRRRSRCAPKARRFEDLPPVFARRASGAFSAFDMPDDRGVVVTDPDGLLEIVRRDAPLDLLIVDEAHELTDEGRTAVERWASHGRHLLLLTATPREAKRQTGAARRRRTQLAWALSVVDPKVSPKTPLIELERRMETSIELVRQADASMEEGVVEPSPILVQQAEEAGAELTDEARRDVRVLARQATLFERVVRTQRRALQAEALAERRLHRVRVELRDEEIAVLEALRDVDDDERLAGARRLASSSWEALAGERGTPNAAKELFKVIRQRRVDAKLEALLDLCALLWSEDPRRKLVVRCEYAPTLNMVADRLSKLLADGALRASTKEDMEAWRAEREGVVGPIARLTASLDSMIDVLAEQGKAAGSMLASVFAFERYGPGGAVALVASDVASTGLNLQFATDLIFYDLPWRPLLAEQWIGRLDRLGRRQGHVDVHVLTHPAFATHALLDLYEKIGLFKAGFRGAMEDDDAVRKLIERADSGEFSWREAQSGTEAILRLRDDDDAVIASRALDLDPLQPASEHGDISMAERVLRALPAAGLAVAPIAKERLTYEITWPDRRGQDMLALPKHRAALRRHQWSKGRPDEIAAWNEEARVMRLELGRLGWDRWRRSWANDHLTPRHPLIVEARDELLVDPTLALGCFKVPREATSSTPGRYFIALSRTDPVAGASAALWRCGAAARDDEAGDPLADQDLAYVWKVISAGLGRGMTVRIPPRVAALGWRIERGPSPLSRATPIEEAIVEGLAEAVFKAAPLRLAPEELHPLLRRIDELEEPPRGADEDTFRSVQAALDTSARHARLLARGVLLARSNSVDVAPDISGMRGIRDSHVNRLRLAQAFFERLRAVDQHAEVAALELLRQRVLAAAVVEVEL